MRSRSARLSREAGADLIDVSAGQTWEGQQPVYGRMFQTPFSDRIRNEARLATMAVGNIYEPDHANSILAAGRADLVALARPHLIDPMWTLRAAAQLDYRDVHVPPQYLGGMAQLARNLKREAEAAAALESVGLSRRINSASGDVGSKRASPRLALATRRSHYCAVQQKLGRTAVGSGAWSVVCVAWVQSSHV